MNELAKSKTAKHRVAANKWYADNKESANREKITEIFRYIIMEKCQFVPQVF